MTMMMTRKELAEIVAEEVRARLLALHEKGIKKPGVSSADEDDPPSSDTAGSPGATVGSPSVARDDQDDSEDTSDDEHDAVDPEGDSSEEPSGAVNDEVSGKTVQSVSIEPKSKVLPGAKEVVLGFNESTDALRILVTPTGEIKFFWRGQLHDLP